MVQHIWLNLAIVCVCVCFGAFNGARASKNMRLPLSVSLAIFSAHSSSSYSVFNFLPFSSVAVGVIVSLTFSSIIEIHATWPGHFSQRYVCAMMSPSHECECALNAQMSR